MTPREAVYKAVLAALRQENFISTTLAHWQKDFGPSSLDYAFAYELAAGTVRMGLALDYIAKMLSKQQKLQVKLKERALLRMSLYQACYMQKIPAYAIGDEGVRLAKKYCHSSFVNYLNAILRQLPVSLSLLPQGFSPQDLSIKHSYPLFFVESLINDYGLTLATEVLEASNLPPTIMARKRLVDQTQLPHEKKSNFQMCMLEGAIEIQKLSSSADYYIQNATPVTLFEELTQYTSMPNRILDLCASPGGKLLLAHDLFPQAHLYANDVSEEKLLRIRQNLAKYRVEAQLSSGLGENYQSPDLFDLIILDVPCSNSGVLHKRPEARWRITPEAMQELKHTQLRLLQKAKELLSPTGAIWYSTCSILKQENEQLVAEFVKHELEIVHQRTILPNKQGWDGGFVCCLKRKVI